MNDEVFNTAASRQADSHPRVQIDRIKIAVTDVIGGHCTLALLTKKLLCVQLKNVREYCRIGRLFCLIYSTGCGNTLFGIYSSLCSANIRSKFFI